MNVTQKAELLNVLQLCNDDAILTDVANVLNFHSQKMILSDELLEKIEQARINVQNGNYISNNDAIQRLSEWSKK